MGVNRFCAKMFKKVAKDFLSLLGHSADSFFIIRKSRIS